MVSDNSKENGKTRARPGRSDKSLSLQQVEELLREDAASYMKQFEKTPQELRQWFDRMIEQLEWEGLGELDGGEEDKDGPTKI